MGKKEDKRIDKEWSLFKISIHETKSKSQDDFEKYINVIASGGLALTIAFFDKIVNINFAIFKGFIIGGWVLLVLTLLSNLISHYLSIKHSEKTIDEINDKKYDCIDENVKRRNLIMSFLNKFSITTLILGISLILVFITINLSDMSGQKNKSVPKKEKSVNIPQPERLQEQKGRTISSPPTSKPNPKKTKE